MRLKTVSKQTLILSALIAAAIGLRLWGIGSGLPYVFDPDEPHAINHAVRLASGDLNPHDFKYPAGLFYVLALLYGMVFVTMRLTGAMATVNDFAVLFVSDPTVFYLTGRIACALAASACVLVAYKITRRLDDDDNAALLAAGCFALAPALVDWSQVVKQDAWLLLSCMVLCRQTLRLMDRPTLKAYCATGGLLGIAASFHYVTGLWGLGIAIVHLAVAWRQPKPLRSFLKSPGLYLSACSALAVFLALNPYALLDAAAFAKDFSDLYGLSVAWGLPENRSWSKVAATLAFWNSRTPLAAGFALLGAWQLYKRRRAQALLLAAMALIYFVAIGKRGDSGVAGRHALAGGWTLLILAGCGMASVARRFATHKIGRLARLLPALMLLEFTLTCVANVKAKTLPDTRVESRSWILATVPDHTKIVIDMPHLSPALPMQESQLRRLYQHCLQTGHARKDYYRLLLQAKPQETKSFEIYRIKRSYAQLKDLEARTQRSYEAVDSVEATDGIAAWRRERIDFIVLSSYGPGPEKQWNIIERDLTEQATLVASFAPIPGRLTGPYIDIYRTIPR